MRKYFTSNKYLFKNFTTTRQSKITNILKENYNPIHLEVINESYKHRVPENFETHFKIIIVSQNFVEKSQIKIHQEIYKQLQSEIGEKTDNKLHALSIISRTPEEWDKLNITEENGVEFRNKNKSPNCMSSK